MYSSTLILFFFYVPIFFYVLKFSGHFLNFLSFFEVWIHRKKRNNFNEEASNSNIASFQEKNDIEKAIIKSNKVLDISSIPDIALSKDNFQEYELNKIELETKYLYYYKYTQKSELNLSNLPIVEISQNNSFFLLVKNHLREYNSLFSFLICCKKEQICKNSNLFINFIGIAISFCSHILFLSKDAYDLNQMWGWIFINSLVLSIIISSLKKISTNVIMEVFAEKNDENLQKILKKCLLIFLVQINFVLILCVMSLAAIVYTPNKQSTDNICIMIMPSFIVDFLFMRNFNILLFCVFHSLWIKYRNRNSIQKLMKETKLKYESNERLFISMIKEIFEEKHEDFSGPSQIISESCSKICFGKKTHNIDFLPNVSELPPPIEEDQM